MSLRVKSFLGQDQGKVSARFFFVKVQAGISSTVVRDALGSVKYAKAGHFVSVGSRVYLLEVLHLVPSSLCQRGRPIRFRVS